MALLITLAVLLVVQAQKCYTDLQCEFGAWSVDTLECIAVGGKNNQLKTTPQVTRNTLATVTTMGDYDWTKIRTLSLKNTNLKEIDLEFFANASFLTTLDLSGNYGLFFPNDVHKFLPNLETLKLSGTSVFNHIEVEKLPKIKMLDISNTFLSTSNAYSVGTGVFNSFGRINVLNLSYSDDINFTVLNLGPSLRSLDVSHTSVILSKKCLQNAVNLRTLVMTHAGLSDIPAEAFRGTNINRIDLSHNKLTADSIINLENSMIHVDVSHNNISSMSKPYLLKYKLRTINLSFNNIDHLHSRSFDNTELYILNISHNLLTSLNYKIFSRIPSLEILDLSYNLITNLSGLTFSELVKLDTLNLAGNRLKILDTALFQKNAVLRHLTLSNNVLESLDIRTFAHLNVTRIIDLRYNLLTTLPEELLHLGNLEHLILSCNRLTFLPPAFFEASADYSDWKVYLQGNPWKCQCLQSMIDALENYQFDQTYFNRGSYPSCYIGESNSSNGCNVDPLSQQDYAQWEQIVKNSGIIC